MNNGIEKIARVLCLEDGFVSDIMIGPNHKKWTQYEEAAKAAQIATLEWLIEMDLADLYYRTAPYQSKQKDDEAVNKFKAMLKKILEEMEDE